MKVYHITAAPNVLSILKKGLKTIERGNNPYGLDTGVDYEKIYASKEEADRMRKPSSIHLIKDYETALFYKGFIKTCFGVPGRILVVDVDAADLIDDPEDRQGYYCLKDIPAESIKPCIASSASLFAAQPAKHSRSESASAPVADSCSGTVTGGEEKLDDEERPAKKMRYPRRHDR